MIKRMTIDEFILRGNKIHNNKYDYSKVVYKNCDTKVCIICPEHGEFWQTPYKHLRGQGCPKCIGRGLTTSDFINKANSVHGNKYNYSKTCLETCSNIEKEKVCIICPEHGEFWQRPNSHLKGYGCPICASKLRAAKRKKILTYTTDVFIEKARKIHGDKYDYSKVEYTNSNAKVCIICPEHGEFWQAPYAHIKGRGCPNCHPNHRRTLKEFIEEARKIHGDKYDYSKVEYINNSTPICIICPEHGEFWQRPNSHLSRKQGCPKCAESKLEKYMEQYFIDNNICYNKQQTFDWAKDKTKLRFDFYLPENKTLVECQGIQHIEPNCFYGLESYENTIRRDRIKYEGAQENGYKLIYITEKKYYKKFIAFGNIYSSSNLREITI